MLPKVYVETSVVSYLTAWPSTDVRVLAKQAVTKDWWAARDGRFELFASQFVEVEALRGDSVAAKERMDVLVKLPMLPSLPDVERLAERLVRQRAIPMVAQDDAAHVAIAAVHGMDYLVTWNFRHINNLTKLSHIEQVCQELGYRCPQICTPENLYGGQT